jgi:hypothetical protein
MSGSTLENQSIYPIPTAGVNEEPTILRKSGEELDEVKINDKMSERNGE